MQEFGKLLCFIGLGVAALGFLIWKIGNKLPIGKLPGDISVERESFAFYAPITTCIVLSVLLTVVVRLVHK